MTDATIYFVELNFSITEVITDYKITNVCVDRRSLINCKLTGSHDGLNGKTDGFVDARNDELMDMTGRTNGCTDGWTDGRTDGPTDGRTYGRIDGLKKGQTVGRTDGRTYGQRTYGDTDVRTVRLTDG